jgi:hypothetical protein
LKTETKTNPSNPLSPAWTRRLDFFALSAWLALSLALAGLAWLRGGEDFRVYYAVGRVLLAGGNPYDFAQLSRSLLEVSGRVDNNPFFYPPWFAWSFTSLAWLPFQTARLAWMLANLALWLLGLWQLGRILEWPARGWRRWGMFSFVTFLFAWITWRYEQSGILLFALLVLALAALQRERWNLAGLWLALLLVKPNLTLVLVGAIQLWLIRRGKWKAFLSMCLALLILLACSTALKPDWFRPLLQAGPAGGLGEVLAGPGQVVGTRIYTTLGDWLAGFGLSAGWRTSIQATLTLAAGLCLLVVVFRSKSLMAVTVSALLANFAVTPYALQYDFPLLTPALLWAAMLASRSRVGGVVTALACLFLASVLIWERPISDGYWLVVGLVVFQLTVIRLQPGRQKQDESPPGAALV